MKIQYSKTSLLFKLVTAIILTMGSSAYCQDKASDWFERGLNAANANSRIAAFEKTVAIDPDYVEAYFYLGLAYKQKNMLNDAELALHNAYFKNPYALNNEIKIRILFEMGAVKSNLGKIVEALNSFKRAKAIAGNNNTLKGRIRYELGLVYIRTGDYRMAVKELREGRDMLPQSSDLFNKAIAQAESNEKVIKTYDKGLAFLNNSKYQQAIQEFEQVILQNANFKDVQAKLSEAKNNQNKSNTTKRSNDISQQALSAKQKKNNQLARKLSQQVAENELNRQADKDRTLETLYKEGTNFLANKDWSNALNRLREVQRIKPGYKKVKKKILDLKQAVATEKNMLAAMDSLYQKGVVALQNKNWLNAIAAFEKVDVLMPGYKDTGKNLLKANLHFNKMNLVKSDSGQPRFILITSMIFLSLLIPVAGVLVFSPTLKARMYLIKGKYNDAARLLEKIIKKKPEKVKLYPLLAHIYLLENRQDETALKIYEMILKLNIITPKRVQINSIVANHYLKLGKNDSSAIEIMEKELSYKMTKFQSGTAH